MKYIILIITLVSIVSCQKKITGEGDGSDPQIYDLGVEGDPFIFTDTASKVLINFKILAKDKNFGSPNNEEVINLREFRSDTIYRSFAFPLPSIPEEVIGEDFFEANITLPLNGVFFTPRFDSAHTGTMTDTLYLEVYVKDDEGKESNVLTTRTLYIKS